MPQYWIQTPVENAKEVVQRYLDANSGTLTGYAGATVSYDEQCEVVLYNSDLISLNYDFNTIYFGTFVVPIENTSGVVSINDGQNELATFDLGEVNVAPSPKQYPGIIWNLNGPNFSASAQTYFIGYKFNINTL